MPSLDEIRTITIQSKTDGVTQSTAEVTQLAGAQDKLADASSKATVVTDTQTRSHLSAQTALDRLRKQIDTNFASQLNMSRGQDVLTRAQQQGLITGAMHADLLTKLNEKYATLTPAETKLAEASAVVESRMVGMSASVGLVGEALTILGPVGLAAAAGLGAIVATAVKLAESANQMGDWARQLQDTSETIRLTTTELQGLEAAGERVGVSADANIAAFEKFTVNLGALKNGTGSLYTELEKVNPSLVDQLSVTRSNTDAWNLLAKAYAQADAQQQSLIAHAAFGRGGAAEGRVLSATDRAGGIGTLAQDANNFTTQQIDQWATLRAEISTTMSEAGRNIASIFTGPALAAEATFASEFLKLTEAASGFSPSSDWHKFIADMNSAPVMTYLGLMKNAATAVALGPLNLSSDVRSWAYGKKDSSSGSLGYTSPSAQIPEFARQSALFPTTLGSFPATPTVASAGVQLSDYKQLIAVLGEAATPSELLHEKLLTLQKDLADHPGLANEAARAQAALNESFNVQQLGAMVAALGAAATPAEHLHLTMASLHQELDRGQISQSTYTRAIANANITYAQAITAGRERLGLLSDEELQLNAVRDIQDGVSKGFIKSDTDMTNAQMVLSKSIKDTSDRMAVLRSPLPQLAQLGLDASNTGKQIDTLATTSLTNLGSGLVDILDKTVTLQDGIKNLEQQFIKSLLNMVVQMTIMAPIARTLQGLLGGFIPGSSLSLGVSSGGSAGILPALHHSGGIVGAEPGGYRYVSPAYFDDAPRFHSGGIAGDEVPIIAKKGEGVFTPGQMAAMGSGSGGDIHISPTIVVQGGASAVDHAQADIVAKATVAQIKSMIQDEIRQQKRPRGLLA